MPNVQVRLVLVRSSCGGCSAPFVLPAAVEPVGRISFAGEAEGRVPLAEVPDAAGIALCVASLGAEDPTVCRAGLLPMGGLSVSCPHCGRHVGAAEAYEALSSAGKDALLQRGCGLELDADHWGPAFWCARGDGGCGDGPCGCMDGTGCSCNVRDVRPDGYPESSLKVLEGLEPIRRRPDGFVVPDVEGEAFAGAFERALPGGPADRNGGLETMSLAEILAEGFRMAGVRRPDGGEVTPADAERLARAIRELEIESADDLLESEGA